MRRRFGCGANSHRGSIAAQDRFNAGHTERLVDDTVAADLLRRRLIADVGHTKPRARCPRRRRGGFGTPQPNHLWHEWAPWDALVHVRDPDALVAEFRSRGVVFHKAIHDRSEGL